MEYTVNTAAIVAAAFANFVVGAIWYTPLFGKTWAKELGLDTSMKPDAKFMAKALSLSFVGNFLLTWVLAWTMAAWQFLPGAADVPPIVNGSRTAFFLWLGFYVPLLISAKTWEGRSWKLIGINGGYYFVTLLTAALILAYWK
jgi:hypothetical protein